jgi:cytochrome P450
LPFIGLGMALQRDTLGFLSSTARQWEGLVPIGSLGPTPAYLVVDPELAGQVLQKRWRDFVRDEVLRSAGGPVFGRGVLMVSGDLHQQLRRTMQPAFTRARLLSLAPRIVAEVERFSQAWEARVDDGQPLLMAREMARLTQEVFVQAMFDVQLGPRLETLLTSWAEVNGYITKRITSPIRLSPRWPTPANLRMRRALAQIDEIVLPLIAERRDALAKGEVREDLLSLLINARDPETGESLDDAMLRDQLLITFFAGFETTSTALTWTWILLAGHPEVERRVHEELDEVLGGETPRAEHLPRLRYLRQVFDETLRLYPSAFMLARQPAGEQQLGGHIIPAGSVVFVSPWVLHRDPRQWPAPERFDPERFADGRELPPFAYIPFGAGPRLCIGKQLALLEAMLILASLARRFRPRVLPGRHYEPEPLFTLHFPDGAPMLLGRR